MFICLYSITTHAEVKIVNQENLYQKLGCENFTGSACFENAEFDTEYNLYMFNFKMNVNKSNLKGLTIEKYIDDTIGPLLGFLNPLAAEFYGIEPILFSLVDEKVYPAENIVLGMKTTFENNSYASYARVTENSGFGPMLALKTEEVDITPSLLVIQGCEVVKRAMGTLTEEQFNEHCNFSKALYSIPVKVIDSDH